MRVIFVVLVCVAVIRANNVSEFLTKDGMFITKYDNMNVDQIFQTSRLLNAYVECLKGNKCLNKTQLFIKGTFLSILIENLYKNIFNVGSVNI